MVHINGVPHDILSAVAAATTPVPNTIIPIVQIMSPSSAVIVPPPATPTPAITTPLSCYDTPNWTDAYGQNCAYYAYNGGYRCALWGTYESSSSTGGANAMGVAVDNCWWRWGQQCCGGGGGGYVWERETWQWHMCSKWKMLFQGKRVNKKNTQTYIYII